MRVADEQMPINAETTTGAEMAESHLVTVARQARHSQCYWDPGTGVMSGNFLCIREYSLCLWVYTLCLREYSLFIWEYDLCIWEYDLSLWE